jgi:hypothetical protein
VLLLEGHCEPVDDAAQNLQQLGDAVVLAGGLIDEPDGQYKVASDRNARNIIRTCV